MNVKETFLKLTSYTIPHGMEYTMEKYLPKNIQEDGNGNYYLQIGESKTCFTAHMDTACGYYQKVTHVVKDGIVTTDGHTVLSADDKAGMAIMLYMIEKKVPGTYYFFQGEESGCVGSTSALRKNKEFFKQFDRMVSFDRRGYNSVITHQMGRRGCSEDFALALAEEFGYHGLSYRPDNTGIYTDSVEFFGTIPECTNLSVGYYHEHSRDERQDVKFLDELAKASCLVKWEELPTVGVKASDNKWYYEDWYD
jgi:putative aminopeptidase FrvX